MLRRLLLVAASAALANAQILSVVAFGPSNGSGTVISGGGGGGGGTGTGGGGGGGAPANPTPDITVAGFTRTDVVNAIAACTGAAGHKNIFFPQGTYTIGSTVPLNGFACGLYGVRAKSILDTTSCGTGCPVFSGSSGNGVNYTIQNMAFKNGGLSFDYTNGALEISNNVFSNQSAQYIFNSPAGIGGVNMHDNILMGVTCSSPCGNSSPTGINDQTGINDSSFTNNYFLNLYQGFALGGGRTCGSGGKGLDCGSNNHVDGNTFIGMIRMGIESTTPTSDSTFNNNYIGQWRTQTEHASPNGAEGNAQYTGQNPTPGCPNFPNGTGSGTQDGGNRYDCNSFGVSVVGGGTNVTINGNQVYGLLDDSISASWGVESVVSSGQVRNNVTYGTAYSVFDDDSNLIRSNISGNKACGRFNVDPGTGTGNTWSASCAGFTANPVPAMPFDPVTGLAIATGGNTGGGGIIGGGGAPTFNVSTYGALGNNSHDDTPNIQAAINAASTAGGGIVTVPAGTYLLNSNYPSDHPWFFYNLLIPSGVTLQATPGSSTTLLQGSGGKHALPSGATEVGNSVIAVGAHYATIHFQSQTSYALNATTAGTSSVTLASSANASHFHAGDYVDILATTAGDVNPAETEQVVSVSGATLNLAYPLARSFPTPVITNATPNATVNVGIQNLIVQGAIPISATEVFGMSLSGNQFIIDEIAGGGDHTLNMNTINGLQSSNNTWTSTGTVHASFLELTQRDSRRITFDHDTFVGNDIGMGEYAADVSITNSHFFVYSNSTNIAGVFAAGKNVILDHNDIHEMNNLNGGSGGWASLFADYIGYPDDTYIGNIAVTNNDISCRADNGSCVLLSARDTVFDGNTITATGNATGIHAEGNTSLTRKIRGNTLNIGSGTGILVVGVGAQVVTNNTLTGTGAVGIYLSTGSPPGGNTISGNTETGFTTSESLN